MFFGGLRLDEDYQDVFIEWRAVQCCWFVEVSEHSRTELGYTHKKA